jgi:hypothetical protein
MTDNENIEKDDRSVAEVIVDLAIKNSSLFFRDQYGIAYALVKIADHNEICRMESARFKRYLSRDARQDVFLHLYNPSSP